MSKYLVTKKDVIAYMKKLEEGSKLCANYFIKDSNEDKIYMIYSVSTDDKGVRFVGVDVEDLSIMSQTILYDYEKIKVTKAKPDYAGRMIITIYEELRVTSSELLFIFDIYDGLNRRIEVIMDDESYYIAAIRESSEEASWIIAMDLIRKKDGYVRRFSSEKNMLWQRDSENMHKFTATKDAL